MYVIWSFYGIHIAKCSQSIRGEKLNRFNSCRKKLCHEIVDFLCNWNSQFLSQWVGLKLLHRIGIFAYKAQLFICVTFNFD